MTASVPCVFFDALDPADRMALYWVRKLFRPPEQFCANVTVRPTDSGRDILGIQGKFADAMAQLTPAKCHWLGIRLPSASHVTENELYCLEALAAAQAGQVGMMQRALRAVFPRARARASFIAAFRGLGSWLAAHGYWLTRPTENIAERVPGAFCVPAPCNRCTACGPVKATLSSYTCLAALSRWRENLPENAELAAVGSLGHR